MAYDEYRTGVKKTKKTKGEQAYSDSKMPLLSVTPTNTEGIVQAYNALGPDTPTNAPTNAPTNTPTTRRGTPPGLTKQRLNGGGGNGASDVGGTETAGTDAVVNAYDGAISTAGQIKADELLAAESNRDKAIQSAQNAYSQMLTTSAQNQEQLARMGLTNSGYSDYINASAQAVKRGEISQAQADYATSVKDIERAYNDAISDADDKRQTAYLTTIMGLESGEISASTALENAKAKGFTEEQMVKLDAMIDASKKQTISDYQEMIKTGTSINAAELKSQIISGNLEEKDAVKIMTDYFDKAANGADTALMAQTFADFDKAYKEELIDLETYQTKYGEVAARLANTESFEGDRNAKYAQAEEAYAEIEKLYNEGKIPEDEYKELTGNLTPYIVRGTFKNDGKWLSFDGRTYTIDPDTEERRNDFTTTLGDIAGDQTPKDGTVVKYQGNSWVRKDGSWFKISLLTTTRGTLKR